MLKLDKIDTMLLDGDGVLWRSNEPLPGLQAFLQYLDLRGIRWALLTNNNTHTVAFYVQKLQDFGVTIDPNRVFTSSTATVAYLLKKYGQRTAIHVVGMESLLETLAEAGFDISTGETPPTKEIVAVVAGMDRQITHEKIKVAMRLILNGAEFVATNTDGSFPTPEGLNPGTGMVIGALQGTTNIAPTVIGKPQRAIFDAALDHFNADPHRTLMVGDRLDTDILGAQKVNIQTALVLTGVTNKAMLRNHTIQPDVVFEDLEDLHRVLQNLE
jgi:4-nitrophenyl phosphatase